MSERVGEAVRDAPARDGVEPVDLVQHELHGNLAGADLREHRLDREPLLGEDVLGQRPVENVQDDVRDERLLEGRRKALHELRRQSPDEADGVRDEISLAHVLEGARRRVERLEEPILDGHLGAGERVEQRRLADVGVPGERHGRRRGAGALSCGASRDGRRPRAGVCGAA